MNISLIQNYSFLEIFTIFIRYATIISLIVQLLYYKNIIPFSYSIFLLITIVFVGGIYITYIKPKYLTIPEFNLKIKGITLIILDFIFHQLPFYIFLYVHLTKKIPYKKDNLVFITILAIIYFLLSDPRKIYYIEKKDIYNIIIISIFISYISHLLLIQL